MFTWVGLRRRFGHGRLWRSQTELELRNQSPAGSLAKSPSLALLPAAHVVCAALPTTAFFAKFG